MKKFILSTLLLLSFVGLSLAEPPKVKDSFDAKVNEIVTFDIKLEKGKELGQQTTFQSKDCMFLRLHTADPSEYSFLLQPKKAGTFTIVFWTVGEKTGTTVVITSTGDNPSPGPGPVIPPKPDEVPVFPDGRYKLSKSMYDIVNKNVPANADRQKAASALGKSFRGIAASIAAGALNEPEKILAQTTESNQSALKNVNVDKSVWESTFKELQTLTYQLNQQERMVTKYDFRDAWNEIALALESVK